MYQEPEPLRISRRLKDALVADLVRDDLTAIGESRLADGQREERDWTDNLGRQLGMDVQFSPGGIHDTLMLIVQELNATVRTWPLPTENPSWARTLAHDAVKHLTAVEVYNTLLVGPSAWRQTRIEDCRVEKLDSHLKPILEKGLAAALQELLKRWTAWDVRNLAERRKDAIQKADAQRQEAYRPRPIEKRIPTPRLSGKEREIRVTPPYQPPGPT